MTDSPAARDPIDSGPKRELSDDLLSAYMSTTVLLRSEGKWYEWSDAELESRETVYVITAYNPYSVLSAPRENQAANAKLRKALDAAELPYHAALSQSPDRQWQEPGFAVAGWTREEACRWGREFDQHAVFEVTTGELRVVECRTGKVHRVPGDEGASARA